MKKPIATFSTDWHIKDDNTEQIIDLVTQQCELNKKLGVKSMICLGDVFNSRKSQSLLALNTFGKILDIIDENKLILFCIAGNHDRVNYESEDSFLDQFKYHPAIRLITNPSEGVLFRNNNIYLRLIPFYSSDIWLKKLTELNEFIIDEGFNDRKNILCSHIAVNGSVNNDGSKQESSIKTSLFKDFHKVFLGHFHNCHKVGKNIYHLPSIQQNNFGEDEDKGFTVLYDDGSHELIKSEFKPFIKVKLDVNKASKKEIDETIKKYEKESKNANIRFILEGSGEKLKSISKEKFIQAGIDVKTKNCEIDIIEDFDEVEITKYDSENIIDEFEEFCELKDLDFKEGLKYLKDE